MSFTERWNQAEQGAIANRMNLEETRHAIQQRRTQDLVQQWEPVYSYEQQWLNDENNLNAAPDAVANHQARRIHALSQLGIQADPINWEYKQKTVIAGDWSKMQSQAMALGDNMDENHQNAWLASQYGAMEQKHGDRFHNFLRDLSNAARLKGGAPLKAEAAPTATGQPEPTSKPGEPADASQVYAARVKGYAQPAPAVPDGLGNSYDMFSAALRPSLGRGVTAETALTKYQLVAQKFYTATRPYDEASARQMYHYLSIAQPETYPATPGATTEYLAKVKAEKTTQARVKLTPQWIKTLRETPSAAGRQAIANQLQVPLEEVEAFAKDTVLNKFYEKYGVADAYADPYANTLHQLLSMNENDKGAAEKAFRVVSQQRRDETNEDHWRRTYDMRREMNAFTKDMQGKRLDLSRKQFGLSAQRFEFGVGRENRIATHQEWAEVQRLKDRRQKLINEADRYNTELTRGIIRNVPVLDKDKQQIGTKPTWIHPEPAREAQLKEWVRARTTEIADVDDELEALPTTGPTGSEKAQPTAKTPQQAAPKKKAAASGRTSEKKRTITTTQDAWKAAGF